jgi:ubiquinone/menaquinone biosynthesis C-methylase UbiE
MNRQRLTKEQIDQLDPYQFMAELGKQVIHPGGKQSTQQVYRMADLNKHHYVLDIGCGVGATAIDMARKYGCTVVASDIDPNMLEKAKQNVSQTNLTDKVEVTNADIQQMPFADNEFDMVIVEAVTMFVNRKKAVEESRRACKSGGKVIEHEFIWRKKPTTEARRISEGEVCPGIKFDTAEDWIKLFEENGFEVEDHETGKFMMMSPSGFLKDEGIGGTFQLMAKTFSRRAYINKMMWMMPRMMKVKSSLGYIVLSANKAE